MAFNHAEKQVAEYQSKVESLSSELRKTGELCSLKLYVMLLSVLGHYVNLEVCSECCCRRRAR